MAELIDDGPLASVREYAAVEQPHLTLPRCVVLGLLARLDAAEAEARDWRGRCERAEALLADLLEEDDDD
jgi:hypothetical protein